MKARWIVGFTLLVGAGWALADGSDDHAYHHSKDHHSGEHARRDNERDREHSELRSHGKGFKFKPERMIKHLDTNEDGLISLNEFDLPDHGSRRDRWDALDSNNDGELSRAEVQLHVDAQWQRFTAMDSNQDNKVTRAEAQAALFSRIDSNSDGFLDTTELKQMKDERRHRRQER